MLLGMASSGGPVGRAEGLCAEPSPWPGGFSSDIKEFCIFIFDLDDWVAMQISWASPLRQMLVPNSGGVASQRHLGVVSLQVHEAEPLRHCAARNAYWSVPISPTLAKYASFAGCDLSDCASDFEKVFKLVRHELGCDEATAIEACRRRQFLSQHEGSVDEWVKSEDVLELLSKDDQKDVLKQRKTATANKDAMNKFGTDLTQRSKDVKARAKAKAGGGNQRRKKKEAAVNPWGARKYGRIPEGDLAQQEIRNLLPPGCSIWCNRNQHSWCAHFPEGKAYVSRTWAYGHRECDVCHRRDMAALPSVARPRGGALPSARHDVACGVVRRIEAMIHGYKKTTLLISLVRPSHVVCRSSLLCCVGCLYAYVYVYNACIYIYVYKYMCRDIYIHVYTYMCM